MTRADIAEPQGPFLLEYLAERHTGRPSWALVRSVQTAEEGLSVASRMSSAYDYRLFISPAVGYLYLDWADDPDNVDYCKPQWVRREVANV